MVLVQRSYRNKYFIIDENSSPKFITFRLKYQEKMIPFGERKQDNEEQEEEKQEPEVTGENTTRNFSTPFEMFSFDHAKILWLLPELINPYDFGSKAIDHFTLIKLYSRTNPSLRILSWIHFYHYFFWKFFY